MSDHERVWTVLPEPISAHAYAADFTGVNGVVAYLWGLMRFAGERSCAVKHLKTGKEARVFDGDIHSVKMYELYDRLNRLAE